MPLLRLLKDIQLGILTTLLLPWASYIAAERLHASGVIAVVASGLILGWYQHEIFTANGRRTGTAVWQVMAYLLEAFVFVLIGLSLHSVSARLGGAGDAVHELGLPVLAVVGAVVVSRFMWILGADRVRFLYRRLRGFPEVHSSLAASMVMGWAGMRGVVTLAVALSLPEGMPGRDLILTAAFAVILVTVLVQGATLAALVRLLRIPADRRLGERMLGREQAMSLVAGIQLAAVEGLARGPDGGVVHPRLLEQFGYRARAAARFSDNAQTLAAERDAHFDVVLAAVAAGRAELLRLHRAGRIHDEVLHALEHDLDLQELSAGRMRGAA